MAVFFRAVVMLVLAAVPSETAHLRHVGVGHGAFPIGNLHVAAEALEAETSKVVGAGHLSTFGQGVWQAFGGVPASFVSASQATPITGLSLLQQFQPGPPQSGESQLLGFLLQALVFIALYVILMSCIAYCYVGSRKVPGAESAYQGEAQDMSEWKFAFCFLCEDNGLQFFFDRPLTWCCACFCPAIRWAETMSFYPGLLNFWPALLIYALLAACVNIQTAGVLFAVCLAATCAFYRQQLRQRFGMKRQGGCSMCTDCLLYLCFPCCAITQEARQAEEALRCGHEAVACPTGRPQSEKPDVGVMVANASAPADP